MTGSRGADPPGLLQQLRAAPAPGRAVPPFQRHRGCRPALYDFITQLAAFDSPIATFLDEEIRDLKNYPMVASPSSP